MSALASAGHSGEGEFEAEVALPFRVEYRVDSEGEVEMLAIVPLSEAMPGDLRLRFSALPVHEQRCLRAAAEADARRRDEAARAERELSRRDSREYWRSVRWAD